MQINCIRFIEPYPSSVRGAPFIRLLFLVLGLGIAGILVARVTAPPKHVEEPNSGQSPIVPEQADRSIPTYAEITLSAPASRIIFFQNDTEEIAFELTVEGKEVDLEAEFHLALLEKASLADTLLVEWENEDQANFLHLLFEPENLESREVTLHFPAFESERKLTLSWETPES